MWAKGTPGHPLASQSLHSPQSPKTQNELCLKGRRREREGAGAGGEGKGAMSKTPNWEGKESGGTSSLPSCLCKCPHPPLTVHTHLCWRGFAFSMRSVGGPTVEKQIRLLSMPLFPLSLCFSALCLCCFHSSRVSFHLFMLVCSVFVVGLVNVWGLISAFACVMVCFWVLPQERQLLRVQNPKLHTEDRSGRELEYWRCGKSCILWNLIRTQCPDSS